MKLNFALPGHSNNVAPAHSDTDIVHLESNVMPTAPPKATIPAEVTVMPISTQRQSSFFEELQGVLFGTRIKVDIPEEKTRQSTPVASSSVKKVSALSIGILAALTGSLALTTATARELRADDTKVVSHIQKADSPGFKAFMERRERVRGKLDDSLNRELDSLTYDRFIPKWSFVTIALDRRGLTSEREQALICPHGYVNRYDAPSRTVSIALPTRYLVTAANLPYVLQMSTDTQRTAE